MGWRCLTKTTCAVLKLAALSLFAIRADCSLSFQKYFSFPLTNSNDTAIDVYLLRNDKKDIDTDSLFILFYVLKCVCGS